VGSSRIFELAPVMDAPIRVLDFQGIPCSVYGSPLVHSGHSMYGYEEPDRKYRVAEHEAFRSKGRLVKINHQRNVKGEKHGNRYLIALENEGTLEPIMEVTNGGRCVLRCKQWAKVLKFAYHPDPDELTHSENEYTLLILKLKERLIV
jgi:hypothetical protein